MNTTKSKSKKTVKTAVRPHKVPTYGRVSVTTQPAHKEALNNIGGGVYVTDERLKKIRNGKMLELHEIAKTNDHTFDSNYRKSGRRVAVTAVKDQYMQVNKIKSLKGKKDKIDDHRLAPLKDEYKCLPLKSGISTYTEHTDRRGRKLRRDDPRFKKTGERITKRDLHRLQRARNKRRKKSK